MLSLERVARVASTKQASGSNGAASPGGCTVPPCALDNFEAVVLEGEDAVDFAQAQFASDLGTLEPGHWQWTCLLTAQGRVVAVALLLRPIATRLLLVTPGARSAELAERLRRFVLRRRVMLSVARPAVYGLGGATSSPAPNVGGAIHEIEGSLRIEIGGVAGRILQVGGTGPRLDAVARAAWRASDAMDGIPWLEGAAVEAWIPQALALGRLAAFSTRKGCYPGQEIVARTHFLGRNKRGLRRAMLPMGYDPPAPGTRLVGLQAAPDAEAHAEVVLAARGDGTGVVLAVARDDAPRVLQPAGGGPALAFDPLPGVATSGVTEPKML
jgi:folate-binding protein YgfZ